MSPSSELTLPHTYHKIIDVSNAAPPALQDPKVPLNHQRMIHCILGGFLVESILLYCNPFEKW